MSPAPVNTAGAAKDLGAVVISAAAPVIKPRALLREKHALSFSKSVTLVLGPFWAFQLVAEFLLDKDECLLNGPNLQVAVWLHGITGFLPWNRQKWGLGRNSLRPFSHFVSETFKL